jgi:hypothetical protein
MKHKYKNAEIFKLAKGKYVITDPCYVYPDEEWGSLCDKLKDDSNGIEMDYNETKFVVIGTAFGDGGYAVTKAGRTIAIVGVDSGLLSIIPLKLAKSWPDSEKMLSRKDDILKIVELKEDSILEVENGDFRFGSYEVITGDDELAELIEEKANQ